MTHKPNSGDERDEYGEGEQQCRVCGGDISNRPPQIPMVCNVCKPDECPECGCINFGWSATKLAYKCDNGCWFSINDAQGETTMKTEFHHRGNHLYAEQEFPLDGEWIERETQISFNGDGSVTIYQEDQTVEVVTLSRSVFDEILKHEEVQDRV